MFILLDVYEICNRWDEALLVLCMTSETCKDVNGNFQFGMGNCNIRLEFQYVGNVVKFLKGLLIYKLVDPCSPLFYSIEWKNRLLDCEDTKPVLAVYTY